MSGLIVLLLVEILLFLLAFSLSGKDIMAPSVMMCIMFLLSTSVAIINARKWDIHYSFEAAFLITTGILAFIVGEVFYRYFFCRQLRGKVRSGNSTETVIYEVKPWKLNVLIIFDLLVCAWSLISLIQSSEGGLSSNLSQIFALNRNLQNADLIATGGTVDTGVMSQLIKIVYASGYLSSFLFVNNLIWKKGKRAEQMKHIFIMAVSVFPSIMTAGRTRILMLASAFLIEYYIVWHQKKGWNRNLSWKYIKNGVIALIAGIPAFYYSAELLGRKPSATLFDYVSVYLGSSIQLFNLYVANPVSRKMIGEESLFSVIKVLHFLGLCDVSTSYNLEIRSMGMGSSNVYTFFRRPLHDFGFFGMYVFTILVAMLFSWLYFKKIKYKQGSRAAIWVLVYGYFYYWIISSSILQYSVTYISVATCIMLCMILLLNKFVVTCREDSSPVER